MRACYEEIIQMNTSHNRRHRHPDYASGRQADRCGVGLVELEDGTYQQLGRPRRTCWNCRKRIKPADVRPMQAPSSDSSRSSRKR